MWTTQEFQRNVSVALALFSYSVTWQGQTRCPTFQVRFTIFFLQPVSKEAMQVCPISADAREVPGKDNWKLLHVAELIIVSWNAERNSVMYICIIAVVRANGSKGSCISVISLTELGINCQQHSFLNEWSVAIYRGPIWWSSRWCINSILRFLS